MRTILKAALVAAMIGATAGGAMAAQGANADGNAGQPRAAYAAVPYTPDQADAAGRADYATAQAQGHRHVDSSWLTISPGAASALLDSGSGQN